jgi:hypothetical protein
MIKYRLQCDESHVFDAWFSSSAGYDSQAARGLVTCPNCGSAKVEKTLMAPNVALKAAGEPAPRRDDGPREGESEPQDRQQMVALPPPQTEAQARMLALMRRVRDEVLSKAENVGPRFVEEARKIHLDEAPARGIYGQATLEDARALIEEGIEVMPLPVLPEDRN